MAKLVVDSAALLHLAEELAIIASEFTLEDANAAELAVAVGNPELGDAVVAFAADWEVRRKHFLDDIKYLMDSLGTAADAFDGVDKSLAAFLSSGAFGLSNGIDWKIPK